MKTQIMKTLIGALSIVVLMFAVGIAVQADPIPIVDRGLPTANLNFAAGELRSNWGRGTTDRTLFYGDDFRLPPSGSQYWRIDTIRVWIFGGAANNDTILTNDTFLGDKNLGNLALWIGTNGTQLDRISVARFATPGSDATNNPNVVATRVQYNDGIGPELDYQATYVPYSAFVRLEFRNLNLRYPGGTKVQFAANTDGPGFSCLLFSNAAYSGSRQDQADNLVSLFKLNSTPPKKNPTARFLYTMASTDEWGKPQDINVQVFATLVNKNR